jgi:3-dehydroquinate synthase class II
MESGADGIALHSNDLGHVTALDEAFTAQKVEQLRLVCATVSAIRQAGMGDRICIDTTSALRPDEGMLLGSTSAGGLLLASETHYLPYMELRPFRVNAGALHHYVWAPNNRTFYLSELRAGMEVLAVSDAGVARTVTIGRLKIERRPLLLIEAEAEGERLNVFIQDDWHVRLIGKEGAIRPSREIEIGDSLLAYRDKPGRHVGIAIDETIREV